MKIILMAEVSLLKTVMDYNPDTGIFTRRFAGHNVKAGEIAGGIVASTGYRSIQVKDNKYLAHRLAWAFFYDRWPATEIDHINHKRDDNRIVNLREVSKGENSKNRKINCNNKTGCSGVVLSQGRYEVRIKHNGKGMYCGSFVDLNDAISLRKQLNKKYNFHPNHGT